MDSQMEVDHENTAITLTEESAHNYMIAPSGSPFFGLLSLRDNLVHLALGTGGPPAAPAQWSQIHGARLQPIPTGGGPGQGHRALADALGLTYVFAGPGDTRGDAFGFALEKTDLKPHFIRRSGFNREVSGDRNLTMQYEALIVHAISAALGVDPTTEMFVDE